MLKGFSLVFLTRGAAIAALYAAITIAFHPISFRQFQVRVSEALTVLAYFEPAAIPGLFIGAMIANAFGGLGPLDIFGGSSLTLIAAWLTWRIRRPAAALLPPVLVNAFGVALILNLVLQVPYLITVFFVGLGQTVAVYGLGYPLLTYMLKNRLFVRQEVLEEKFER